MKTVKELLNLAQTFYTPMSIEQELILLKFLQELDRNEIISSLKEFYSIFELLYHSQVDNYVFERDEKVKEEFDQFYSWLENLKNESEINKDEIENLINVFTE